MPKKSKNNLLRYLKYLLFLLLIPSLLLNFYLYQNFQKPKAGTEQDVVNELLAWIPEEVGIN